MWRITTTQFRRHYAHFDYSHAQLVRAAEARERLSFLSHS